MKSGVGWGGTKIAPNQPPGVASVANDEMNKMADFK